MNTSQIVRTLRPQFLRPQPISRLYHGANFSPKSQQRPSLSNTLKHLQGLRRPGQQCNSRFGYSSKASFPKPPEQPPTSTIKSTASPPPHPPPKPPQLSLSQRLRKLSREYGWSALGVYLALTALDFPFCFVAVRWLGTDRIGHWEHVAVQWIKTMIPENVRSTFHDMKEKVLGNAQKQEMYAEPTDGTVALPVGLDLHGVEEAERENKGGNASIWTQLALAYAIHKSFIFVRVPITAAITPKVVKTLRGWGWNIGKRRPKAPKDP